MKLALTDLYPEEIAKTLALKPYQGTQIFRWLHRKKVASFGDMTDLSKSLRDRLDADCRANQLELIETSEVPGDATKKVLFRLCDGNTVESVLLRDHERVTLCLSSQVGCAIGCGFCATGQTGYIRNLSPGEIVEQALRLLDGIELEDRAPNIVYMGMGEPFHNYDNVTKSIRLFMHDQGLNVGARRITVSTVGDVPGIRRFADEPWQVRLAISLHAATDELRSRLVPLNKKYPLRELIQAARHYIRKTGRQVSFEYVLLDDTNDSPRQAQQLADLIEGINAVVNLIPYNPVDDALFESPSLKTCETFRDQLARRSIKATLRHERGRNINAACGQLRAIHL